MHHKSQRLAVYTSFAARGLRDGICTRKMQSFGIFLAGQLHSKLLIKGSSKSDEVGWESPTCEQDTFSSTLQLRLSASLAWMLDDEYLGACSRKRAMCGSATAAPPAPGQVCLSSWLERLSTEELYRCGLLRNGKTCMTWALVGKSVRRAGRSPYMDNAKSIHGHHFFLR